MPDPRTVKATVLSSSPLLAHPDAKAHRTRLPFAACSSQAPAGVERRPRVVSRQAPYLESWRGSGTRQALASGCISANWRIVQRADVMMNARFSGPARPGLAGSDLQRPRVLKSSISPDDQCAAMFRQDLLHDHAGHVSALLDSPSMHVLASVDTAPIIGASPSSTRSFRPSGSPAFTVRTARKNSS